MNWALEHHRQMRAFILGVGLVAVLSNLLFSALPFGERLVGVAANAIVVPLFFGVRWVIQLQILQHGLRPWIKWFACVTFVLAGCVALAAIPMAVLPLGEVGPAAICFLLPATLAYSAIATIARTEEKAAKSQSAERSGPVAGHSEQEKS